MEPLALYGNSKSSSNTNLSTTISLSIFDKNENEVPIKTSENDSFEIIIPRDPNIIIPMILHNVSSTYSNQSFELHYINITSIHSISIHIEIHPLDRNISYLFIYKFDQIPRLNQNDDWILFCSSINENIYKYFIDNQRTKDHRFIIFGLRELNSIEINDFCSNSRRKYLPMNIDEEFNFTSDYEIRIYSSSCVYLDSNNQWKSDGLRVGNLTNIYQTQCFSTHLTRFASGIEIIPSSINWEYVFANADFVKNKTIYLTVICVLIIYIILIIYAHYKDKKHLEKLGIIPLSDNHPSNHYYYQIIVFTGQRKDAGTKSKIHFILSGDKNDTQIRTFSNSHREIF
jgi:hypothetical protein